MNNQQTITIQPMQNGPNKPYPYHIERYGLVGRQDFWGGHPYKLIGFAKEPVAGQMDVEFKQFWKDPEKAKNKFPVFSDIDNNWYTEQTMIEEVHINNKGQQTK